MIKHLSYRGSLKKNSQKNRKLQTKPERLFWYMCLNRDKTGYRFLRQKPLLNYIVDFYCANLKLVFEIDGDSHEESYEYDDMRTELLGKLGVKVVRFGNDQVEKYLESVYYQVMNEVEIREKEMGFESE